MDNLEIAMILIIIFISKASTSDTGTYKLLYMW